MAQVEWVHRLFMDDWYIGEVYPVQGGGWATLCQLTRGDNMLPCEQAKFTTLKEARDALEEQGMVMFIATDDAERTKLGSWKRVDIDGADYAEVLVVGNLVFGWVMQDAAQGWIARVDSGAVRALFDTAQDAKDFVMLMANVNDNRRLKE